MESLSSNLPSAKTCLFYSALTVLTLGAIALTIIGSLKLNAQYSPSALSMVIWGGVILIMEFILASVKRLSKITDEESEDLKKYLDPGEYFKYGDDEAKSAIYFRAADTKLFA